ncbi:RNA polymerase sigma factor [Armatimonas rosea]|uniref:RNA polymerase sigma factor n=1 Tax=Armatimonas rosea TaxID=685828 RepID=A0A7W9SNI4_ARMRO|nr:sigma-70 family RNA polymerase sigma factor [Armatimonas rosea]MBB6049895.1 RNA polymerase sigma-70 factor (ECF subfamily) [Armatimonas rosea]
MQVPDLWLVRRAKNGDTAAFGALLTRHSRRVYNLLLRLTGSPALAEDLTQETFLTAYQRLADWRGTGALSTWLCGIAVKHHLAARRKSHFTETLDAHEELAADLTSDPLARYTQHEAKQALNTAISALPLPYREVFVLVRVQELRYREVAELLEIPLGTVQSRLAQATVLLQHALSPSIDGLPQKGTKRHVL